MAGDREAFGLLFTRHRERLWAVAVRTLGRPDEAADALQDAMISAFRQAGGFRGDSAVTTWLHRIVVNACLDRLRRRAARPATGGLDERALDSLALHPHSAGESPDPETSLDVAAALRSLPPEQRAALVLVDMLGYTVADAAELLKIPAGTVKSRCARGRARLLPKLAHLRGSGATEAAPKGGRRARGDCAAGRGDDRPQRAAGPLPRNQVPSGRVSPREEGGEPRL